MTTPRSPYEQPAEYDPTAGNPVPPPPYGPSQQYVRQAPVAPPGQYPPSGHAPPPRYDQHAQYPQTPPGPVPPDVRYAAPPLPQAPKKRRKWPFVLGGLVALIVIGSAMGGGSKDAAPAHTPAAPAVGSGAAAAAPAADVPAGHTVVYRVTGPARAGNVTYMKEGFQTEQVADAKLPWSKTLTYKDEVTRFSGLSLVAQNGGGRGDITCTILVDGKEVASSTSSGPYSVVSCTGANS